MTGVYVTESGSLSIQTQGAQIALDNLKVDGITAGPSPPGRQAVLTDFTRATWTGYVMHRSATYAPIGEVAGNGMAYSQKQRLYYSGPDDNTGVDLVGQVWYDDSDAVILWMLFDTPVPMRTQFDALNGILTYWEDGSLTYQVTTPPERR